MPTHSSTGSLCAHDVHVRLCFPFQYTPLVCSHRVFSNAAKKGTAHTLLYRPLLCAHVSTDHCCAPTVFSGTAIKSTAPPPSLCQYSTASQPSFVKLIGVFWCSYKEHGTPPLSVNDSTASQPSFAKLIGFCQTAQNLAPPFL
jgi:hypothetical protein